MKRLALSAAALLGAVALACALGSLALTPAQVWGALTGGADPLAATVVLELRLPRALLAAAVGAALALAGVALQGLFRNPLADPYVLGVSAGGALGAALALVAAIALPVPVAAFAGALAAALAVYTLARQARGLPLATVLLAGIAVGLTLSAALTLVLLQAGQRAGDVLAWLLGSLGGKGLPPVAWVAGAVALFGGGLWVAGPALDALELGEDVAAGLGMRVERVKLGALAAAAGLTAAAVAFAGLIGFVGLLVPHAARWLAPPAHRARLPLAALLGALTLVLADLLARTVPHSEWPVGVVTGLLGGPLFLGLLRRSVDLRQ
ncbi:MAG: iron chelate uptake ABC transporter family permease subunit [Myxococcales bacterium]|nr:iron chelate uptake ABC transporter family permease subunit [Myxococcales bacterium]